MRPAGNAGKGPGSPWGWRFSARAGRNMPKPPSTALETRENAVLDPWLLCIVLLADAALGDPPGWPHLVRLMGWSITKLEGALRRRFKTPAGLRLAGLLLTISVVGGSALAAWGLTALAGALRPPLGAALAAVISFQCLAAGQLWREVRNAARPLERGDLETARRRLAMSVGRRTDCLDAAGLRRALIETAAENLNDGVIAPLFYLVLAGPAGALAYKAVNTLDSMVGYRDQRYRDLGLVPARLDDLAGWLPARLTALLMIPAAGLLGLDPAGAWRVMLADHAAHHSPNAGWPEAACAGALGARLGGPSYYHETLVDKPWLGAGSPDPGQAQVEAALRLLRAVTALAGLLATLSVWHPTITVYRPGGIPLGKVTFTGPPGGA
jgi:adenosylcobinamide-phosphate synthase